MDMLTSRITRLPPRTFCKDASIFTPHQSSHYSKQIPHLSGLAKHERTRVALCGCIYTVYEPDRVRQMNAPRRVQIRIDLLLHSPAHTRTRPSLSINGNRSDWITTMWLSQGQLQMADSALYSAEPWTWTCRMKARWRSFFTVTWLKVQLWVTFIDYWMISRLMCARCMLQRRSIARCYTLTDLSPLCLPVWESMFTLKRAHYGASKAANPRAHNDAIMN